MGLILTAKMLQYILLPLGAGLGIMTGILLPRTAIAQRHSVIVFLSAFAIIFLVHNIAGMVGGSMWARATFAFTMGFIALGIKLLR